MTAQIYCGDCRNVLPTLPAESVQCVVTSPPYWGLRSYGIGAENGELGCEPTPELYVEHLVQVFREVRRVMREDAVLFLNLGDSYQDKQLVGIPWRVAFALQADGWWLRSDIIWHKPNCMPESVTDRPTKAHEYVFLLSKSARYFYDADAVREPGKPEGSHAHGKKHKCVGLKERPDLFRGKLETPDGGRNRRTVWTIPTRPYKGAHFATFPPALVEPCILAGTSERGCCPACGAPWKRITKSSDMSSRPRRGSKSKGIQNAQYQGATSAGQAYQDWRNANPDVTVGWRPTCDHDAAPVPCIVLDPFAGSGTVGEVCATHHRQFVGIDLNPDYIELAKKRVSG